MKVVNLKSTNVWNHQFDKCKDCIIHIQRLYYMQYILCVLCVRQASTQRSLPIKIEVGEEEGGVLYSLMNGKMKFCMFEMGQSFSELTDT